MYKQYKAQDALNKKIWKREVVLELRKKKAKTDAQRLKIDNDKKLSKLKKWDWKMEEKIRRKYPNVKTQGDLAKLGAFVTFNRTS